MPAPETPYQPYSSLHDSPNGPGDSRPTAMQIVEDAQVVGKFVNRTILITGASSGLGAETARALYATGARLFLTARDNVKLEKVIEDIVSTSETKLCPRPEAIEMHLDSLESVRKAAEGFKQRSGGQLSILLCNAGIMASPYGTTKDGFELQMGTNFFAHFLLFQLLKPLLLATARYSGTTSRVINLASTGHRLGGIRFDDLNFSGGADTYDKWAAYGQSKTANIYMANALTRRYEAQNLVGLSLHPGSIFTDLGRHLSEKDFQEMGGPLVKTLAKSPKQGAATTVWAAVTPHFEGENGGRYLTDCGEDGPVKEGASLVENGYAKHAYNEIAEERLWKVSCEILMLPAED